MASKYLKCDFCRKKAKWNYQKAWKKYKIDENGDFFQDINFDPMTIEEPTGEDNYHLCDEHALIFEETGYPNH